MLTGMPIEEVPTIRNAFLSPFIIFASAASTISAIPSMHKTEIPGRNTNVLNFSAFGIQSCVNINAIRNRKIAVVIQNTVSRGLYESVSPSFDSETDGICELLIAKYRHAH